MRRLAVTITLAFGCAGGALVISSIVLCDAALRVPKTAAEVPTYLRLATAGASWTDAAIQADDGSLLRGWFVRPLHADGRCVILLHGIGDSRLGAAGFAPMFLEEGYSALVPDSRAHGTSGGEIVTYGFLERYDVVRWAQWLSRGGCARIYGLGESLGAAVLIQAAAVDSVFRAIVAEGSYADLNSIAQYRVAAMLHLPRFITGPLARAAVGCASIYARLRYRFDVSKASPLEGIRHTDVPVLLIHGLKDVRTRPAHSELLARANPKSVLWLVPEAGHGEAYSTRPGEFRERVLGWFAAH